MQPTIAIVTGGSRGIGAASAALLAQNGCRVVVNYNKNKEAAERLCERLNADGECTAPFCADVADPAAAAALAAFCAARFGAPDLLVLNAGVAHYATADETAPEDWRRVMDTNAGGAFNVARAAIPAMVAKKRGAIVAVSSVWGISGASCESAYAASKAAVIGLIKSLARELAPSGITANCVAPGFIETDMAAELSAAERAALLARIPLARAGRAEEVARLILALCQNEYLTGQVVAIDGGGIGF